METKLKWQDSCPPYCERCERYMKLVRTVPKLGGLPPLDTYHCVICESAHTVERKLH